MASSLPAHCSAQSHGVLGECRLNKNIAAFHSRNAMDIIHNVPPEENKPIPIFNLGHNISIKDEDKAKETILKM